jgi:hypothetical protein
MHRKNERTFHSYGFNDNYRGNFDAIIILISF